MLQFIHPSTTRGREAARSRPSIRCLIVSSYCYDSFPKYLAPAMETTQV